MSDKVNIEQNLIKIKEELEENNGTISKEQTKQFWKIIGQIKRDPRPNEKNVIIASEIRDKLYVSRLGNVKPIGITLILFSICGFGFILSSIFFSYRELYYYALLFALVCSLNIVLGVFFDNSGLFLILQ